MMDEQNYEQEINIGKMFYRIFRDWRKVIITAMVVAVMVGAGNYVIKKIKTTNEGYIQKAEENFKRELVAFQAKGETLLREIENLEETRMQRESYNADSILMNINPYREFNGSLELYIATDYQIVPELTYQNIDLSTRILRSYFTYMSNGDMYQYILEHLSQPMELRYLKEILSIVPDYDNRMITLNVRNIDAQSCEEVLTWALEGIMAKRFEIMEVVGEHELNSVNHVVYESVSLELDEWQKANIQYVSDLSVKLQEKGEEYDEWGRSAEPQREYTTERILKDSIKKFILGFMVGAVLAAVFIAFCYIMSDKLQDAKHLKQRFGLRVITQVPKVHGRRVWGGIDRLFARMGGLAFYERDTAALIRVAAQSVKAELTAMGVISNITKDSVQENPMPGGERKENADGKNVLLNKVRIAFTGSVAEEEIRGLILEMEWENSFAIQCVSSILTDSAAVSAVMEADYVVLVEKQERSTYSKIGQELTELAAWKKNVLGFIVIGVDAIP